MKELTTEQKTAREINETPTIVTIGEKEFKVKPLTFGQIIDMSAIISTIKDIEKDDDGRDMLSVTIEHIKDVDKMLEMALVVLYRKATDREKNRLYIKENLGENEYMSLQEMYIDRLNTDFFLTNIIILKSLNLTAPTKTI